MEIIKGFPLEWRLCYVHMNFAESCRFLCMHYASIMQVVALLVALAKGSLFCKHPNSLSYSSVEQVIHGSQNKPSGATCLKDLALIQ